MRSLRQQTASSVKWTTFKTVLITATLPALQIVLARFLSPEEFAYIAIILIFIGLFETLENFGISQAVIQRDSIDDKEASSLFFLNILSGIFLSGILYFLSKPLSVFFQLPGLSCYLKLTSLIVIIGSPAKLFKALMQKHLFFKALSLIELARHLTMMTLVILLLSMGHGVQGFIYANIMAILLSTLLIVCFCIKNHLSRIYPFFSLKKIFPFLSFGIFVSGKQVMTYCAHHMDEVLVGYFLNPEVLGVYSFGKRTIEKIRRLITESFGRILFPVFSNLKNEPKKISTAYLKITKYVAFVSFPVFAGIAITAHLFVPLIFGEKWVDSIIVFQVFSVVMLLIVLTANIATSLLYALNRPDIVFYVDIVTNIFYFSMLYIFSHLGINAVLIIYPLYIIYKFFALQYYANKYLKHSFILYFKQIWGVFIISVLMVSGLYFFQLFSDGILTNSSQLIWSIATGCILFLILSINIEKSTFYELKSFFMKNKFSV